MKLDENELGYFIQQVGLSAASFGAATDDVTAVGDALSKTFGYRCSPEVAVIPAQGPQYQAVCQADSCPLSPNATCAAYPSVADPTAAATSAATSGMGNATMSATMSSTMMASATPTAFTGAAPAVEMRGSLFGAVALAALAWFL